MNPIEYREVDELTARLREAEATLTTERRRHEGAEAATRVELGAALAEAAEARSLADNVKTTFKVRGRL